MESIGSYSAISPVSSPEGEDHDLFHEKIVEIIDLLNALSLIYDKNAYSLDPEDYPPWQRNFIRSSEGEFDHSEVGSVNALPFYLIAFGKAVLEGDLLIFLDKIEHFSLSEIDTILDSLIDNSMRDMAVDIYQSLSEENQVDILERQIDDVNKFMTYWEFSAPAVKEYKDPKNLENWLHKAIKERNPPLVEFLLEEESIDKKAVCRSLGGTPLGMLQYSADGYIDDISDMIATVEQYDEGVTEQYLYVQVLGVAFDFTPGLSFQATGTLCKYMCESLEVFEGPDQEVTQFMRTVFFNRKEHSRQARKSETLVYCGWYEHATCCIFAKNFYVTINTGCPDKNINFYLIGTEDKEFLRAAIARVMKNNKCNVHEKKGQNDFNEGLKYALCADHVGCIDYSQIGSDCTIFSLQGAVLAYYIIAHLKAYDFPFTQENIDFFLPAIKLIINEWENDYRIRLIDKTLPFMMDHPEIYDIEEIIAQMKEYCRVRNLEKTLNYLDTIDPT